MLHVQPPTPYHGPGPSVFLAGSAGGRSAWRRAMVDLLRDTDLAVLDPFVADFPKNDPATLQQRTRWEFDHLRRATVRAFWFPADAAGMISLYELGVCSVLESPLVVGIDPGYPKSGEIRAQMRFIRPKVRVVDDLEDLVQQIVTHPAMAC